MKRLGKARFKQSALSIQSSLRRRTKESCRKSMRWFLLNADLLTADRHRRHSQPVPRYLQRQHASTGIPDRRRHTTCGSLFDEKNDTASATGAIDFRGTAIVLSG